MMNECGSIWKFRVRVRMVGEGYLLQAGKVQLPNAPAPARQPPEVSVMEQHGHSIPGQLYVDLRKVHPPRLGVKDGGGGTMGLLVELKPESGNGAALAAAVMELIERYAALLQALLPA